VGVGLTFNLMGLAMSIKDWSENIILAELQDDPHFSDDLNGLQELVQQRSGCHVVLDFSGVHFLNSSNIAKLLKLRKLLHGNSPGKLRLCGMKTEVWGVFLVTGLDKIFECCNDVTNALASIQIDG
jgi:anti-anti-sigma factor